MEIKKHCPYYNPDCPTCPSPESVRWGERFDLLATELVNKYGFMEAAYRNAQPAQYPVSAPELKDFVRSIEKSAFEAGRKAGIEEGERDGIIKAMKEVRVNVCTDGCSKHVNLVHLEDAISNLLK